MIGFFRYFAKKRGALSALFLIHIFTFIPASILLWFAEKEQHYVYYLFAGGIAVITSWIVLASGEDFIKTINNFKKEFLLPANIFFIILYLLFCYGVSEFYFIIAELFAPFEVVYVGPSRLVTFLVVMACYNSFLIPKIFRKS